MKKFSKLSASVLAAFTALVLVAGTTPVQAQTTSLGVRGGVNFSGMTGDNAPNSEMKVGGNFGAFAEYSSASMWGVTAEINYMMKGTDIEEDNNTPVLFPNNTNVIKLNYLNIPVYGNLFFGTGKLRPKIFLGPSFNVLMQATATTESGDDIDLDDTIEGFELAAVGGVGLHYQFTNENWAILDVRYHWGISDIHNDDNVELTNQVLSVNLGFSFPVGNTY